MVLFRISFLSELGFHQKEVIKLIWPIGILVARRCLMDVEVMVFSRCTSFARGPLIFIKLSYFCSVSVQWDQFLFTSQDPSMRIFGILHEYISYEI